MDNEIVQQIFTFLSAFVPLGGVAVSWIIWQRNELQEITDKLQSTQNDYMRERSDHQDTKGKLQTKAVELEIEREKSTTLQSRFDAIETQRNTLIDQFGTTIERITQLEKTSRDQSHTIQVQGETVVRLEKDYSGLAHKYETLSKRYDELERDNKRLESENKGLKDTIEGLMLERSDLISTNKGLKTQVEALKEHLEVNNVQMATNSKIIKDLADEIRDLKNNTNN